jgi:hypothetical protein
LTAATTSSASTCLVKTAKYTNASQKTILNAVTIGLAETDRQLRHDVATASHVIASVSHGTIIITRPVNGFFCSKSWHVPRIHFISPLDCSGGPSLPQAHALRFSRFEYRITSIYLYTSSSRKQGAALKTALIKLRPRSCLTQRHAYVRGNTAKFYEWLEEKTMQFPSGPAIWTCGDCHSGNLGPIASREGEVDIAISNHSNLTCKSDSTPTRSHAIQLPYLLFLSPGP